MKENRGNFASRAGAILAAAGSAVGLGNVWRFPYETGNNGGAAFILIYVACILLLGMPVMLAEFAAGRNAKSNAAKAYSCMGGNGKFRFIGYFGVLTGFLILSYYGSAAGWTLEYLFQALVSDFSGKGPSEFTADFSSFVADPVRPVICLAIFLGLTCLIIVAGVQKGIERGAKIMMPLLFIFIIVLVICSVSLPGGMEGVRFMLKPDFSKVTHNVVFSALGQAFFSLSLGMGCLTTYASYFNDRTNLASDAMSIISIDTLIAILSGLVIFPAAFSVGIPAGSGPSLVFITLPNVFQTAFGSMPVVAYLFTLMFYGLLAVAALTSSISMLEVVVAFVSEELRISRMAAAVLSTLCCLVLGLACTWGWGIWKEYTVFGLSFFDLFDFLTAKIMLPLGGFMISVYVGWFADERIFRRQITNDGQVNMMIYAPLRFLLRYVAPVGIMIIFLNEMGLIKL